MPVTLDGCFAKMARAEELIGQLEQEFRAHISSTPPPYQIVGRHTKGDTEFEFVASGPPAPLRFSVISGEIVHHLRSALDHVVWGLAMNITGNPGRTLQFPICATKQAFDRALDNGMLKGIGTAAIGIVASVQPFKQPVPQETALLGLHELNLTDKHRLLAVVGAAARLGQMITLFDTPGVHPHKTTPYVIVGMSPPHRMAITPAGAVVFSIQFADPTPHTSARADFEMEIVFERVAGVANVSVIPCLSMFLVAVRNTVSLFKPLY